MANADTPEDALAARNNGAEGIGLCRTEHMVMILNYLVNYNFFLFLLKKRGNNSLCCP
jgi:phosphoenolpyruvate synthase/pyruvate phosphate dikinase